MIDKEFVDFTLIPKQTTIEYFKDIDTILQALYFIVKINLESPQLDEYEEYNANDNNWIPLSNQLEEGSHMLVEETIEIDLSNDHDNLKIIQLGRS